MARYTSNYCSLLKRLDEVKILINSTKIKESKDPIKLQPEINALCRGSIVLLSSHLEAYIKELGESAIDSLFSKSIARSKIYPSVFYHSSKDYIDEIKNSNQPEKISEKIFTFLGQDGEMWRKDSPLPRPLSSEKFNKGFASPSFDKIKAYFNRFGYSEYQRELSRQLKGHYLPVTNMINQLVDTRNQIAHGDPSASKTPQEVDDMKRLTTIFCRETDIAFADWWKKTYCSIR